MEVGGRAPTVGALGDAGAVAEKAGIRVLNKKLIGIGIGIGITLFFSGKSN